jgi:hypothetical protein
MGDRTQRSFDLSLPNRYNLIPKFSHLEINITKQMRDVESTTTSLILFDVDESCSCFFLGYLCPSRSGWFVRCHYSCTSLNLREERREKKSKED